MVPALFDVIVVIEAKLHDSLPGAVLNRPFLYLLHVK